MSLEIWLLKSVRSDADIRRGCRVPTGRLRPAAAAAAENRFTPHALHRSEARHIDRGLGNPACAYSFEFWPLYNLKNPLGPKRPRSCGKTEQPSGK